MNLPSHASLDPCRIALLVGPGLNQWRFSAWTREDQKLLPLHVFLLKRSVCAATCSHDFTLSTFRRRVCFSLFIRRRCISKSAFSTISHGPNFDFSIARLSAVGFIFGCNPSPPCPSRYLRRLSRKGIKGDEEEEEAETGAGIEAAAEVEEVVLHEAATNNPNDQTRRSRHQQHRSRIPVPTSPLPALQPNLSK